MKNEAAKLSESALALLKLIPAGGGFIGNTTLQRTSGLGEKYWDTRRELLEADQIILGKGKGGSVARRPSAPVAETVLKPDGNLVEEESDLYEPLRNWLQKNWGRGVEEEGDFFMAKVTATGRGRPRASGQWSRPDVTVVQANTYEFLPQVSPEVTTFEVKRYSESQNIAAVYEAVAHSRWAHYSYLVVEVPNEAVDLPEEFISEVERFRLGLMLMWRNGATWEVAEEEWETDRHDPDPKELQALLKHFFQDDPKGAKQYKKAIGK